MNKRQLLKGIFILFTAVLACVVNGSYADTKPNIKSDITLENFWVALPPDVARTTAGYGIIKNSGDEDDILLAIRSDGGSVMLHKTDLESGRARMLHMSNMLIEAGTELVLEPMSFHLMFSDLCPIIFTEGGSVTLWFEFEKAGVIEVHSPIRPSW